VVDSGPASAPETDSATEKTENETSEAAATAAE
jgi:hypothetical protein